MRTGRARILILIMLVTATVAHAQFDPKKVCRVEDGRMIFTLDQKWTVSQRKEIARMFDLDSALLADAFALKPLITSNGMEWKTRKLDAQKVELSSVPGKSTRKEETGERIFLVDDQMVKLNSAVDRESVPFGVNRLTRNTIVQLSDNRTRFFLPGQKNAKTVFLSGSFNGWSTLQTPLQACDSGWTVTLKLQPGKYSYKFIIDGRWTGDPYNKLRENDTYHGFNNIFYCYNYKFVLKGYPDAHRVQVAGSFNQWNPKELNLIRFRGNWVIPMFLREGTHAYKFIVDGEWITDPANKVTRPDGRGNLNSFLGLGDTLFFTLSGYPGAKKVMVCGDFNAWNQEELAMDKIRGGWQLPYVLAPGNYQYKFLVDGEWITDPGSQYRTGTGETVNSFMAVKPNYTFRLEQHSDAKKVVLSGSFNGWNKEDYRMIEREGTWLFPMYLKPGKYTYKFVVDQKWIIDPANELWEENEYGTGNSVLWIEP